MAPTHPIASRTADPLTLEAVRVAIASLTAPWTIAQLSRALDRPEPEVGAHVAQLIDGRTVIDVGPDPRHEGEGTPDRLYGLVVI